MSVKPATAVAATKENWIPDYKHVTRPGRVIKHNALERRHERNSDCRTAGGRDWTGIAGITLRRDGRDAAEIQDDSVRSVGGKS
ncbi:hypothetical protein D3C83_62620 [compost metagenome]